MRRIGPFLLAFVSFFFAIQLGLASQHHRANSGGTMSPASPFNLLDPYLVAPNQLNNIDLGSFLQGNPNLANYSAAWLSADTTSAAIVLFQTSSLSDVTFTVTDGTATLLPYAANFLTQAPQAGAQSLVVSNANFINVNGTYYVPALLQGPLGGYTSQNAITVNATQDSSSANANIALVVPPLMLVHGLWGDKSSLEQLEGYVDSVAPWKSQTQLVVPICYSLYLAFDATKDPYSGKDPCEVTSESAVQTEVDSLLAELDGEHVVGGRVDIAAHSMGGLVARNYASQSSYASPRNRMQGQFHTVVTLDTPEIGSLLANYLVQHRLNTRRAPKWTPPGFIWSEVCGSSDVETSFNANGYPLAHPGAAIKSGAVYSLEPSSPSLTNPALVGPNIPNSTWRAVSATKPGNSALAIGLDTLISALYSNPYGNSVPTVDTLLKNKPNDAIVTVASQIEGAGNDQSYTFSSLSHTSLVSSILTWLTGDNLNDNSVTDDPSGKVDSLAACWLSSSGANSCLPQDMQSPPSEMEQAQAVLKPVNRIDVQVPQSVVLGTPFEVAVHVRTQGPSPKFFVYQRGEVDHTRPEPVAIERTQGGIAYVRVTPKVLGPITLGVSAAFSDGGVSAKQSDTYVVPPKSPPLAFHADDLPTLVMTLNRSSQTAMAHPFAVYPAPVGRVDLNPGFVRWTLLPQKGGAPAVSVDGNGFMHAVRPGSAMAEARFGSSVARLRVLVRASQQ